MDFDLQLAKEQSEQNPVYYVQYMHARIAGILRNAAERGFSSEGANPLLLQHSAESGLVRQMLRLEEVVELAATRLEPHHLPHYALELARSFSVFYDQCRVLSSDPAEIEISLCTSVFGQCRQTNSRVGARFDGRLRAGRDVGG